MNEINKGFALIGKIVEHIIADKTNFYQFAIHQIKPWAVHSRKYEIFAFLQNF